MSETLIAALDVGKTHTRLSVIEPRSNTLVWSARQASRSLDTPLCRQLDLAATERWLAEAFQSLPQREHIRAIVPVAHGAAAVLLDSSGSILAAPDYEDPCFESVGPGYETQRDPYSTTYSPSLPRGLNLGRQLFYLECREPGLYARVRHILPLPQYWAWRLSGVMSCEATSLGCHTDLWLPQSRGFAPLTQRRSWSALFAPLRSAAESLGQAVGPLAQAALLPPQCRVACGIHDSNLSYLQHLLNRRRERFTVISSGTWTVLMASGGSLARLREGRDMLANVDAFGSPVATARFMGGREYEIISQTNQPATAAALEQVLGDGAMALPAFAAGGPFAACQGQLPQQLDAVQRAALATLYTEQMSELLLDALGAGGDVVVEGPLAANSLFGGVLARLRPRNRVLMQTTSWPMQATAHLAGVPCEQAATPRAATPLDLERLNAYRNSWREALPFDLTAAV